MKYFTNSIILENQSNYKKNLDTKYFTKSMGKWYDYEVYEEFLICEDIPLKTKNGSLLKHVEMIFIEDAIYDLFIVYYGENKLFFIAINK